MSRTTKSLFVCAIAIAAAATLTLNPVRYGLDLTGGASLVLEVDSSGSNQPEILEQTRRIVERKINAYGVSEATVQPYGAGARRLLVQIPGEAENMERIRAAITRAGILEWFSVADGPFATRAEALTGPPRLGQRIAATAGPDPVWYRLQGPPVLRGDDLRNARATPDLGGGYATAFTLSNEAGDRFARFTEANIGRPVAVVIDGAIASVGNIQDRIASEGQIRGAHSATEAEDLAILLRAGAVPAAVRIIEESTVAPSLGADSIRQGITAGLTAVTAVVAAMLAIYRSDGWNAALTLALNGLLLLALLAAAGAVLTMAGIAGLILTAGMAVDSNVLVFERLRELRREFPEPAAVARAFDRAWTTIVDTHVTTMVCCGILFVFGSTAVKGFAVTLGFGLLANLFTAVFVSRLLFEWRGHRAGHRAPALLQ
ncbi:MAG: protein translocase subunit SecD [Bryobacteraceae bacterium]